MTRATHNFRFGVRKGPALCPLQPPASPQKVQWGKRGCLRIFLARLSVPSGKFPHQSTASLPPSLHFIFAACSEPTAAVIDYWCQRGPGARGAGQRSGLGAEQKSSR